MSLLVVEDSATAAPVSYTNEEYLALRVQHVRLKEQLAAVQRKNVDLEDKLIHVVEKTEGEKLLLSHEIDELATRLAATSNNVQVLEDECARYKKDCVLAVHLLQCQPSPYVAQKLESIPADFPNTGECSRGGPRNNQSPHMVHVASATFPPMAAYFCPVAEQSNDNLDQLTQPDDPIIDPFSISTADKFVEQMRSKEMYSTGQLKQCPKCGTSIDMLNKAIQCSLGDISTDTAVVQFN